MNARQRLVLRIMAAVILVMILLPPYVRWSPSPSHYALERGYGFILDLPTTKFSEGAQRPSEVDIATLASQVIGALIVGDLILLSLGENARVTKPEEHPSKTSLLNRY